MFPIQQGPRGGRFFIDAEGRKVYVARSNTGSTTKGVTTRRGKKTMIGSRTEEGKVHVAAWSAKRNREYEHIEETELARGVPENVARRIAAATVNKVRAMHGEVADSGTSHSRSRSRARK